MVFFLNEQSIEACAHLLLRKRNRMLLQNDPVFLFLKDTNRFFVKLRSDNNFAEKLVDLGCRVGIDFSIGNQDVGSQDNASR